jgi:hypothetical protein
VAYGIVLRMIASLGAGQVHCTVIDPQAIGGRFERLVRLSAAEDANVELATSEWQIEKSLAEIQQHLARVSRSSGDVADLHRVLIVLGVPAAESLASLQQIIASGAIGGVSTVLCLSGDVGEVVSGMLSEVSQQLLRLVQIEGQFHLQHDKLGAMRVVCDEPPPASAAMQLLRRAPSATNGHAVSSGYAGARR